MAMRIFNKRTLALLLTLVMCFSSVQMAAHAAPWDNNNWGGGNNWGNDEDESNWSYAYYLGQEYLGNASGAAVKPDPVGYGFQGVITSITFTDDSGTPWTFTWNSTANGEWRITGNGVSKDKAAAWPDITDDKIYVGVCNGKAYTFTLGNEGNSETWTYVDSNTNFVNWFRYIRFIREYTVNVFYQNETGSITFNGETFAQADPVTGSFTFLYPNGGIIDDSQWEDGEYTEPTTLFPADYLPQSMIDQGFEIKYATDANGNDVLTSGVTISLLGDNVLNVYCTLKPPATENYTVIHNYYMDGTFEGTQNGGTIEVTEGSDFSDVVNGIAKLPEYNGNTYTYIRYDVDPADKVITLSYNRARPTYDYTVTYNANFGENPATASDGQNVTGSFATEYTMLADPCTFERANYYFSGWNTQADGKGTAYAAGAELNLTAENNTLTLYAQWTEYPKYDYTVTYNEGYGDNPTVISDEQNKAQTYLTSYTIGINENTFSREHYDFIGWATELGGSVVYQPGQALTFTEGGSQVMYAVWKEHNKYDYALSYNGNGGKDTNNQTLLADEENVQNVYDTTKIMGVNTNTFSREHYTFIGWNTKADGTGTAYAPGAEAVLTSTNNTMTLYAQWVEHPKYNYTVIYNANFGTDPATKTDAQNVTNTYATSHNVNVDSNEFQRTNYTFTGWNTAANGSGISYTADQVLSLTKDNNTVTLYAQWQENAKYDYIVTYNDGYNEDPATAADEQNKTQIFDESYAITVNSNPFSREHYDFIGWATEKDGEVVYQANDVITFTKGGNEELFAVWAEHDKYSYTVIYNGNGGALANDEVSYGDNENVTNTYATSKEIEVDENTFSREHYDFIGWNTKADGSGTNYSAEDVLNLTSENNSITLYAQWEEHEKFSYTVIYNDGYNEEPVTEVDSESIANTYENPYSIEVNDNPFTRENYTFIGWAVETEAEAVAEDAEVTADYVPGDEIAFQTSGTVVLRALWVENPKYDYELTYMGNGGLLADDSISYKDGQNAHQIYETEHEVEVDGNSFVREHYDFIGWNTKADGSGTAYSKGSKLTLDIENPTAILFAQWKEHPKYAYSVIYNANFGEAPETKADAQNVTGIYETEYNKITTDDNTFVRANYTFIGWNTEADGSGETYAYTDVIKLTAEDNALVLYAQWEENPKYDYTVTYNEGYGLFPETKADAQNATQIYLETYAIKVDENTFVRANHDFIGWATEKGGEVAFLAGDTITFEMGGSEELFAVWAEHDKYSYTVIYNGNGGTLEDAAVSYGDEENVVDTYATEHTASVDENTFSREHYDFIGWNTETDGSGDAYTAEDVLNLTVEDNSITLYAQWEEHEMFDYEVIYHPNTDDNTESIPDSENEKDSYETEKSITIDDNTFVNENENFIGWSTEPDGEVVYKPGDVIDFSEGGKTDLYAQWEPKDREYTVEYWVQIDNNPYALYEGEVPAGGVLPHGTVVGMEIVNPPASITDGTYTYEFVRIDEIVLGEGDNVVKVFFRYETVLIPDEPVPEAPAPEQPAPETPAPEQPAPEAPATVDNDGLVDLPNAEVPLAEVPNTGDPMLIYAGMTLLSGAGLAYLGLGKKKEEEENA